MAVEKKYRLDKTAFKTQTFKEADDQISFWKDKTYSQRLEAASYLICQAYNVKPTTKLDRTKFSKWKHG